MMTELVSNSLKHAFDNTTKDGQIIVSYGALSVADNGIGKQDVCAKPASGLGAGIIDALARQLAAKVESISGPHGTTVTVGHVANGSN
jgi:two-component sensor histidine kinase